MLTIIVFILVLSLLVLAHEFGHFLTARKAGMKVHEFGIGFPPRALGVYKDPISKKWIWLKGKGKSSLSKTVSGAENKEQDDLPATLYSLNWLPLGGFVRIKGENGEAGNETDSFGFHKAWKKVIVLSAGVIMNVILAGILLSIGFGIGLPTDLSAGIDEKAIVMGDSRVMVQYVENSSPAKEAGIKYGDQVLSIDGQQVTSTVLLISYVQKNPEKEMKLLVQRDEQEQEFVLTPRFVKEGEEYPRLGIMLADAGLVRYPWHIAAYKGMWGACIGFVNIMIMFAVLIKNLVIGNGLMFEVSGPVGIAVMVGDSARLGFNYLLNMTAMISLSLAVINILPLPALDGGRILFILIEKIIRRPVPMKYEQLAHTIGFVLLMVLVLLVTGRDILHLIFP